MKAIVFKRYGGPEVLELQEIDKPAPREDDVLIKVRAASVNPLDWHFMRGEPYLIRTMTGFGTPKQTRVGVDVAGEIEAVGAKASEFKPGDAVFGASQGSFAEYVCTKAPVIALKPANVSFEHAAAANIGGSTALQALRAAKVQPGQKVLINGAAGGVGTFAVQIAKIFGAHVTGVCSTRNIEMVRSIGADRVIDYTREDFTRGDERYDVILDNIANHPLRAFRRILTRKGVYLMIGGASGKWLAPMDGALKAMLLSMFVSQKLSLHLSRSSREDLITLGEWLAEGKITPVIDRQYELQEVPEAVRYVEQGHARGKVIVRVSLPNS